MNHTVHQNAGSTRLGDGPSYLRKDLFTANTGVLQQHQGLNFLILKKKKKIKKKK
jgi:hypothetical protein